MAEPLIVKGDDGIHRQALCDSSGALMLAAGGSASNATGIYTAPVALAAGSGEFTVAAGDTVRLVAGLYSTPDLHVHFRVLTATGQAATTLATSQGFIVHSGSVTVVAPPSSARYVYWRLIDGAGAESAGGAEDRLHRSTF